MKKIAITIVLGLLCANFQGKSQTIPKYQGLKVGDKIPDVTITNLINYSLKSIKLSDFKGKIVLLDFWATWCSSCIVAFPEATKLQKQYKDDLQILLINPLRTRDDLSRIKFVLSKLDNPLRLPIAVKDSTLDALFPIPELPHYVWIDREGIVMAITDRKLVNAETMSEAVHTGKINSPEWTLKH